MANSNRLRVLLTGASGQLGQALQNAVPTGVQLYALPRQTLDVTQRCQVEETIRHCAPHIVLNTAAYTQMDMAEKENLRAYAVNRDAVAYIANAAKPLGIPVIHISTDYVFDGTSSTPYSETDKPDPISIYGKSKLAGEEALLSLHPQSLVIRTSAVFSQSSDNFVTRILKQAMQPQASTTGIAVVDSFVSGPTPANALAQMLWQLVALYQQQRELPWGILHYTGTPACSRYQWAKTLLYMAHACQCIPATARVEKAASQIINATPRTALRAPYSALSCQKIHELLGIQQPAWKDAIKAICPPALKCL